MERFDATRAMDICGNFDVLMKQMDDGQFVRYKDHQQALAAAQERIKVLEGALDEITRHLEDVVETHANGDRNNWDSYYLPLFKQLAVKYRAALKEPPC